MSALELVFGAYGLLVVAEAAILLAVCLRLGLGSDPVLHILVSALLGMAGLFLMASTHASDPILIALCAAMIAAPAASIVAVRLLAAGSRALMHALPRKVS